ncbi:MAG: OmpA family protein [Alphaproteobacteria bacterium]
MRPGRLAQTSAAGITAIVLLLAGAPNGSIAGGSIGNAAAELVATQPPEEAAAPAKKTKPVAAKPPVSSFAAALADEYAELVRVEAQKRQDGFRAAHFTAKAKRAAAGVAKVPPEDPVALGITGPNRVALAQARSRLIGALERSARRRLPALAAKTQAKFDCWAERIRGRYEPSAVTICREQFMALVVLLEKAVMPLPVGSRFTRALTREYLAYADYEARTRKDWINARHFARKGLRAADAKSDDAVPPEPLGRWNLHSRRHVPAFAAYRARLLGAFSNGARTKAPAEAARAQARFDCWVERTAGRADADAVETCRREFMAALTVIEGRGVAKRARPAKAKARQTARSKARTTRLSRIAPAAGAWTVFFAVDKDDLRAGERPKITAVAKAAKRRTKTIVTVTGHADLTARADYNTGLSLRRAANVRLALIRAGVAPERVRIFARGERKRAASRRVTIRLRAVRPINPGAPQR